MRGLTLAALFLATLVAVNAACPTDCLVCKDPTLNPCTLPNPAGGCIAPCTVPKCPQKQKCGIDGVWDRVNCQCVANVPVPVACPKSCLHCKDTALNSCWTVDTATDTCVLPCSQPKCKGKCSAGFHWDGTHCKCDCTEVETCDRGRRFDTTKCACVDNQPTKPVCVDVVDCLEGFSWNPVDCKCERKVQCWVDPCGNKKCEYGSCVSNFAGGCNAFCPCDPNGAATCKAGEWWNSQSCTCEQCVDRATCVKGTHWSPLACKCVPSYSSVPER